ncbi:hypothetical protein HLB44_22750 [Aquincola sp. S2]|uniref:DUF3892 domain-containing protein n=1 Tax=Pseudaquabacterium terrae TaxID=2732868 RepID=A0ABX2EMH9_9BURK|nr:hypothetical protein [Aquabacterium terrae]NRF69830.1 hypothetical protein [Aquabacterium terrae]
MTRGITHVRLGLDGRIAVVRWQEVATARMPTGAAQEATLEQLAAAIEAGETIEFWSRLNGGQRASGGEVRIERDSDGKLRLIEARASGQRLDDLPRF